MNWLTLEGPAVADVPEQHDAPVEAALPAVPTEAQARNDLITQAWRELTEKQREFIREAEAHKFGIPATLRAMEPFGPKRNTIYRWLRTPAFALVWKCRLAAQTIELLDKSGVVAAAGHIRDQALKPKPVLFQGAATGFAEQNLGEALRANEQLARLGGHMKNEETVILNQGPGLVIQVVQKDGQVIDVAPRGVVVDLPPPSA